MTCPPSHAPFRPPNPNTKPNPPSYAPCNYHPFPSRLTSALCPPHPPPPPGLILQFDLFLENSYGLLFFLFFLFQLAMSSLALFVAAFVRRTQVGRTVWCGTK